MSKDMGAPLTGRAATATQPSPTVSGKAGIPSAAFPLKAWDVTVHGYGVERINAASRGKALAKAWRCDAFSRVTFGDFLKIAEAWRAMLVPSDFGEPILVQSRPAFRVGRHGQYVSFVWPYTDTILVSHPSDVSAAIAMEAREGRDGETRLDAKHDSAAIAQKGQGK